MGEIVRGSVNEIRKRFNGDGIGGKVEFGRSCPMPNGGSSATNIRVTLDDGRQFWGKYSSPQNVLLQPFSKRNALKRKHGTYK